MGVLGTGTDALSVLSISTWHGITINWHLLWLWAWFLLGMFTYWLKRAYYVVTGPNPMANSYSQFVKCCWVPLFIRMLADSAVFWALFTPGFADRMLSYLGWTTFSWVVMMVTQFAVFAAVFGHTVDSVLDFALSRIPGIKDLLPQMPVQIKPVNPVGPVGQ